MRKPGFSVLLLALVVFFSAALVVQAVPPQPTTLYGKVQEGGADVPDGTSVTAWMGSTESIVTGTPISFPATGVSITFSADCTGDVTVLRQAGETQVVSQDGYTSVYALNVLGPSDWEPPANPATEGMSITLKISDTVATTETWSMGTVIPLTLTVDSLAGDVPYTPGNVTLLGQVWDISASCTGFTATLTFAYDDSLLGDIDEADIAGMAHYDPGYNRWEYLAGTVDTNANTITVSDVTAFSQWKILASTPPLAVADLSASRSGSDLVLDWSAVTQDIRGQALGEVTYNVYRAANDPYFTPSDTPYDSTGGTMYTDSGVTGDPDTDYYYVVTVLDGEGNESALSERGGLFHTTIASGWNMVSLPLVPGATGLDDVIGDQLTGTCDSATADRMLAWNPTTDEYEMAWYCDCDAWGEPWDNHWLTDFDQTSLTFEPDVGVWIQNRSGAAQIMAMTGIASSVNREVQVDTDWQMLGSAFPVPVALDNAAIPATGTCDSATADRVLVWNPSTEEYEMAWYCDCDAWGEPWDDHWLTGFDQTSIQLESGKGMWYHNRHTPFTWVYPNPGPGGN
jgi:hypothetical protein